eukprot:GHVT01097514.1.p1 GENE.GHVT01097514.1~~GHVT01097514.1.p1  ORF type:complete len:229 (+),score=6.78 GHVT01097514.1:196-882(+)
MQNQWKVNAFHETISEIMSEHLRSQTPSSVISIGDGDGEREACLGLCRQLGVTNWYFKSLKLLGQPTCDQLISEHVLIQQTFIEILKVKQSLDMTILDYNIPGPPPLTPPPSVPTPVAPTHPMVPLRPAAFRSAPTLPKSTVSREETILPRRVLNETRLATPPRTPSGSRPSSTASGNGTDAYIDLISEQLRHHPFHNHPPGPAGSQPRLPVVGNAVPPTSKTKLLQR